MREIKSLTGLRGYAALWVCLHHYHYGDYAGELNWYLNLAKQGSWGVIIFFVLSGFIMAYVYQSWFREGCSRREYWHFMFIRFARVYPLHLLTLLLWLGFCVIGFIGYNQNDTAYTFVLNLLLLHAWGFTDAISWNQPSWSISTELFCYLVFPFWIAKVCQLNSRQISLGMLVIALAIIYPPHVKLTKFILGWFDKKLVIHQFEYGFSMITWFFDFALGSMLFGLVSAKAGEGLKWSTLSELAVCVSLVVMALMATKGGELGAGIVNAVVALTTVLLIHGLYRGSVLGDHLFGCRLAVFLGNVSYGLYLSHIMTPLVINQIFIRLGSGQRMTAWPMGVQLIVALAVAALLHHGFEKPARRWIRSRWTVSGGVPA